MKIYRNGQEFELTFSELINAHNEYELDSMTEDVRSIYEQEDEAIELSENDIKEVAIQAKHNLTKNDSYFEAYWESVRYTLKEYMEERKFEEEECDEDQ